MDALQVFEKTEIKSHTQKSIGIIKENLPEITRAVQCFGRQNSQTTAKMMSLTMTTACSPYRMLRQCLAEIEKRKMAIQEASFNLRLKKAEAKVFRERPGEISQIEAKRREAEVAIIKNNVDGAIKDMVVFIDAYNQIKKTHGIRENWDEKDFEEAEIKHHIKTGFQHAYRDMVVSGTIGMGTLEYIEQFGMHPQVVFNEVKDYMNSLEDDRSLNAGHLHAWMDQMYEKYKDNYKVALKNIGLENLFSLDAMFIDGNEPKTTE